MAIQYYGLLVGIGCLSIINLRWFLSPGLRAKQNKFIWLFSTIVLPIALFWMVYVLLRLPCPTALCPPAP